ncbi:MAG: YIP1 family protein [Caldilineaceae bacterium]|nr:YIP1 family protein [Caldilineaceae bacterium]
MDFGGMIETWSKVLIHPGEETFVEERTRPQATIGTALLWIVIAAVVTGILGWLQVRMVFSGNQFAAMIEQMDLPPEATAQMNAMIESGMLGTIAGGSGVASIIITPIFFLIGTGILQLIARMFGGSGEFGRFAYLLAAIQAPISILNAVLGFVPFVGGCVAFALWIYSVVLTFFAIKAEHGLSDGRAIGTLLVPLVLVFLLFACAIAGFAGMIMSLQQGT